MASMHLFESVDPAKYVFVSSPGHTFNQILPSSNRKLTMGGFPSISALCVLKIQNIIGYYNLAFWPWNAVEGCGSYD